MAESPTSQPVGALTEPALDADGRLLDEFACRRCGYSLRGLKPDDLCPECRTPVARSVRGDLLQFSDPHWVERIARGSSLVAAAIVLQVLVPAVLVLALDWHAGGALAAILVAAKALQACGYWMVTSPDPAAGDREPVLCARRIARWMSVTAAAFTIAALMLDSNTTTSLVARIPGVLNRPLTAALGGSPLLATLTAMLIDTVSVIALIALLSHACALALRMPDKELWKKVNGILGVYALAAPCHVILRLLDDLGLSNRWLNTSDAIARLLLAACGFWGMLLVFNFNDRLRRIAALARETWAGPIEK